jgi:hypothetical protein
MRPSVGREPIPTWDALVNPDKRLAVPGEGFLGSSLDFRAIRC